MNEAKITGVLSVPATIKGNISTSASFIGAISVPVYPVYDGECNVVPKPNEAQTLETKNKIVKQDITVKEIPYYEVSNTLGKTVYIGKEIEIYGN